MKKLLGLLAVAPIMATACTTKVEDTAFATFTEEGTALVSYNGKLDADNKIGEAFTETTYDSGTYKYSQSLELRSGDAIKINFSDGYLDGKTLEESIGLPTSDAVSYCINGTSPTWGSLVDGDLKTKEYLASIDGRKTTLVDLSGDTDSKVTNYTEYFNGLSDEYQGIINDCYDIGNDKTFIDLADWIENGGYLGTAQSFFPIVKPAGYVEFEMEEDSITVIAGNGNGFTDSFRIKDANTDEILSPNLSINLDKGTFYLQNNWRSAQLKLIGGY